CQDIDAASCEETAALVSAAGGKALAYAGDVADQATFAALCQQFAQQGGRIDAIVNNAMILKYGPVEAVVQDSLTAMLAVGINPLFWSAQALLRHMDPARGARMINMASPVCNRGYPNTAAYTA